MFNQFQSKIDTVNASALSATTTAQNASSMASLANEKSLSAVSTANTALEKSQQAIIDSIYAKNKSEEVELALVDRGATVNIGGVAQVTVSFDSDPQTQLSSLQLNKLNANAQAVDSAKIGGKAEAELSVSHAATAGTASACTTSVNLTGEQIISGNKTFSGILNTSILKRNNNIIADDVIDKSVGKNGFIKFSSGLIIQWGEFVRSSSAEHVFTFYTIFFNKLYGCGFW